MSSARPRHAGAALRHVPPEVAPATVVRPRLIAALRGRFDRRLTVVTASAGFGKTTLLAQAVDENRMEQAGTDVWLRAQLADRDPDHLLAGLAHSLAGHDPGRSVAVEDLAEEVWSRAPTPVALLIDDAHLLDGSPAWAALAALLDAMPANGHLVVTGRTSPTLPVARLLATDQAEVVTEAALGFTPAERAAFATARAVDPHVAAHLPSWPALAVLRSAAGSTAAESFVWEEVLSALPAWQVRILALAEGMESVDDQLVEALAPGSGHTAADAVRGVPLVQADGQGAYRLHALLADVVRARVPAHERATVLAEAGRRLLAAGADRRAVEAAALAGDHDTAHRAICRFGTRPIRTISVPDVVALSERLPRSLRAAPVGSFLHAARHWEGSADRALQLFREAEARARAAGDDEVEALCTWRVVQLVYLDDHAALTVTDRHRELARRDVPMARSIPAFVRSVEAQRRGDVAAAVAALDDLDDRDPDQRAETVSVRLLDLGRPEQVPADLDDAVAPGRIDVFAAQALWLRAAVDPEVAWSLARAFPGLAGRAGVQHDQVSVRAIVAIVALAVGEVDEATALVEQARSGTELVGAHVVALVTVAEALLDLQRGDEARAVAGLRRAVAAVPLDGWPPRPFLYALAPLRALVPETAELLDRVDLGPALASAVAAGRALAAARAGDPRPAAGLPWRTPRTLRCAVPPPLLAELALAAIVAGEPAAEPVLATVPGLRAGLARVATRGPAALAAEAAVRLARLPGRPGYDVRIEVLGDLRVRRSDGAVVDESRTGRARVRQLLAALVLVRRASRVELAARLWPDLPADKAAGNLRANLRHLQAALQPDRAADEPAWFVRIDGDALALAGEGLTVDVHELDDHVARAVAAEAAGTPSVALTEYRAAAALYRGELFPGLDDPDVDIERARLRSVAHAARCRVGELVLARGEPEAALREAAAALRLEPLSERAHRLFVRAHVAVGSTTQARAVGRRLRDLLAAEGLEPEPETAALLRRVQA